MSEIRLNARVHAWASHLALGGTKNDSYKVIKFSRAIVAWDNDTQCIKDIGTVYDLIHAYYVEKWKAEINRESGRNGRNKLRTYKMLKQDFRPSEYVNNIFINKRQCSALAKFRCGVETGRYENLPEEQRLCPMCDSQAMESEIHVLIKCNLYIDMRTDLFHRASSVNFLKTNAEVMIQTAKTCHAILSK